MTNQLELGNQRDATAGTFDPEQAIRDNLKIADDITREAAGQEREQIASVVPGEKPGAAATSKFAAQGAAAAPQHPTVKRNTDTAELVGLTMAVDRVAFGGMPVATAALLVAEVAGDLWGGKKGGKKSEPAAAFPGHSTPSEQAKKDSIQRNSVTQAPAILPDGGKSAKPFDTIFAPADGKTMFPGATGAATAAPKSANLFAASASSLTQPASSIKAGNASPATNRLTEMMAQRDKAMANATEIRDYLNDGGPEKDQISGATTPTAALARDVNNGNQKAVDYVTVKTPTPFAVPMMPSAPTFGKTTSKKSGSSQDDEQY